jgi:hypothetical protein
MRGARRLRPSDRQDGSRVARRREPSDRHIAEPSSWSLVLKQKDHPAFPGPLVELELAALDTAPVREVIAEQRLRRVVDRSVDRTGETRVAAVGADSDCGSAQLGAAFDCRVDQNPVQHAAARTIPQTGSFVSLPQYNSIVRCSVRRRTGVQENDAGSSVNESAGVLLLRDFERSGPALRAFAGMRAFRK